MQKNRKNRAKRKFRYKSRTRNACKIASSCMQAGPASDFHGRGEVQDRAFGNSRKIVTASAIAGFMQPKEYHHQNGLHLGWRNIAGTLIGRSMSAIAWFQQFYRFVRHPGED
jgi:hypothetical protein